MIRAPVQQAEQQGCGDVVGQVADHAQPPSACRGQCAPVELERIARVQHEAVLAGKARTQAGSEITVDLDDVERAGRGQQRPRDGALARADFHQRLASARRDARDDALDHAGIVQEVLAKAPARADQAWCSTIAAAVASAARRLPEAARPLPARSSAVP